MDLGHLVTKSFFTGGNDIGLGDVDSSGIGLVPTVEKRQFCQCGDHFVDHFWYFFNWFARGMGRSTGHYVLFCDGLFGDQTGQKLNFTYFFESIYSHRGWLAVAHWRPS